MPKQIHLPGVTALSFVLLACTDKAKPDFERCQQLDLAKRFDEARKACELATSKDPESKSGKLAAARLPVLATELRQQSDEQQSRDARALSEMRDANDRLRQLKAQFESAAAKEAALKAQLEAVSDPSLKAKLQSELAEATAAKDAVMKESTGAGSSKQPCNCAPDDPLCSCF